MSKFTWTPETVEQCATLYAQGQHSAAQIGDIIGTSKGSVIGKMDRLGVRSPRTKADNVPPQPRAPRPAKVNPAKAAIVPATKTRRKWGRNQADELAALRELTGEKQRPAMIFDPDDISNDVLGKHPMDKPSNIRMRRAARLPQMEVARKVMEARSGLLSALADVPAIPTPETPVLRLVSHGKTLLHLSARECRYAVGTNDAGEHTFCAAPTPSGSSWCEKCAGLVYTTTEQKQRKGHTAGKRFG